MRQEDLAAVVAADTLADRLQVLAALEDSGAPTLDELLDAAERLVHDRPAHSWALAELAAAAAADPGLRARSTYLQARIAAERGQLERALGLIEASRRDWNSAGQPINALRTDLGRMQVLDDLGRHEEAIEIGTRLTTDLATDLAAPTDPVDPSREWLRATAHNNLGAAYGLLGDHVRATEEYGRAEAAYEIADLPEEVAKTQANRGIELLVLGQAREALVVLLSAEQAFRKAGDRAWAAKCAGHVGAAYRQLGELVTALQTLREARTTLVELGAEVEAARLRSSIAEVYLAAGLYAEARNEASQAAAVLGSLHLVHDQAVATFTEALAALESGDPAAAEEALGNAAELFERVGDRHYRARVAQTSAELAARSGRPELARAEAAAAAATLMAGGWSLGLCWARLRQADSASDGDERDEHLAAAAELVSSLRLPSLEFALVLRKARRQREQGDIDRAHLSLRDAIALTERAGATLTSIEVRPAFRADHAAVYDDLVDLLTGPEEILAVPDRSGAALLASHRAKSVTLAQIFEGSIGRRAQGFSASSEQTDRARADLSALYHALSRADSAELAEQLGHRATELERQLTLLQLDDDLARSPVPSPAPDRTPQAGPAGTRPLVVAYHLLEADLVVFVDDGEQVTHRRVPNARAELELMLDRMRAHWNQFRIGPDFVQRHRDQMHRTAIDLLGALHRQLIGPVADLLPLRRRPDRELVVVPHQRLHQVPFAALHDGSSFLLEQTAVVVAPTVTAPQWVPDPAGGGRLLVVGVPDETATSISAELTELQSVRPDAEVLLGEAATTTALRSAVPGPAYVHIACHGLFRASNPMFSAIRLHDRWLTAAELLEYDLGGALVTLGACETGRSEPGGAEATGMSWSLLTSGASGVIVSHWLVDDVATARFTPELYRNLTAGLPPAQALRRAQLAAATLGVHPFYWAAFSYVAVHGDARMGAPAWPHDPDSP